MLLYPMCGNSCLSSASLEIRDAGNELRGNSQWILLYMSEHRVASVFDGFIDLNAYDTIALKVKGDGRSYISTIYTKNWVNSPGQEEDNSCIEDSACSISANMERERYRRRLGNESIPNCWHVSYLSMQKVESPVPGLAQVIFKWKSIGLKPSGQHSEL
ncbi:unnamed protein product [Camellia sinensis]